MKKVLIIGYITQHGAGIRVAPLAKYLPEFGWQPIVLTAPLNDSPPQGLRVIETPYRDALAFWKRLVRFNPEEAFKEQLKGRLCMNHNRKVLIDHLLSFLLGLVTYPDAERGWQPFATRSGIELLQSEPVDAMISCRPITSNTVAHKLKEHYHIPWVVDYTDPWSQNTGYDYGPLRRRLDRRLELKTVASADALVSTSEPWAERLRTLHTGKPVFTITHGFDPEEANSPPAGLTRKFTITYTGTIYTGNQDPTKLFHALRDLISEGILEPGDIEVRFYGRKVVWLEKEIENYGLSDVVRYHGQVPRETVTTKQRESHLLLVLDWEDLSEAGVYTGKIFEYLGVRRPILATGGQSHSIIARLLADTGTGCHAPTVDDIKNKLKEIYQEYKLKGYVSYSGREAEINKYSHREMARKFAEILEHLTRDKKEHGTANTLRQEITI
jgi:glycosyltransferase involved in cell wall biosynthesis